MLLCMLEALREQLQQAQALAARTNGLGNLRAVDRIGAQQRVCIANGRLELLRSETTTRSSPRIDCSRSISSALAKVAQRTMRMAWSRTVEV